MKITSTQLRGVCAVILIIIVVLTAILFQANPVNPIRVACIGDSITAISEYPVDLQAMLGRNYKVSNFGVVGTTLLSTAYKPYIYEKALQRAKLFQPNIVVIMLGTNDAHVGNYPLMDSFVADYENLISEFQVLLSNPEIFLVKPPPIFTNEFGLTNALLVEEVIIRIEQVAKNFGLLTIDVYNPFVNHPEYFKDGVHPTSEGASIIASEIYREIIQTNEKTPLTGVFLAGQFLQYRNIFHDKNER
jgi:acyl-CoA thioesterase-1